MSLKQRVLTLRKYWKITLPSALVVVAGIVAAVVLLDATSPPKPTIYTNLSRHVRVCLVTSVRNTARADQLWPAVQAATAHAAINAQRINAPATSDNDLGSYLNSAIAMHCAVIVAVGDDLRDPAIAAAKTHSEQHFLVTTPSNPPANAEAIPATAQELTNAVITAAHAPPPAPH
ncbi:hypothetical protein [Amycolatopsis sp. GM8]|uniref:hypothetical protein n=1 Tax=Amycolatopsis sp. GM8 TaxID=2896530 RepID=UPI001F457908|nr:hypothetical protein [Amycolatopsis sp. GM8]